MQVCALSEEPTFYWVLGKVPTGPGRPQHVQLHMEAPYQAALGREP